MEKQPAEEIERRIGGVKTPGEEAACLQVAVGILGGLLLIASILLSRWRWSRGTGLGVLVLLLGVLLAGAGGFMGLGEKRRRRASALMSAGGTLLTASAIVLLLTAGDSFNWHVPLGSIFLMLAIFSSVAAYKFRRVVTGRQQ